MATLNLGRIKPVFQGAYNGSTAYVVDDIVTFGDETFICIQASTGNATSNASYWTKLAAKGTDGTDVATTLTTQGDILYRDGSGLARLGYGTNGQVLTTGGSGANPSWTTASSGKIKQVVYSNTNQSGSTTNTSYQDTGVTANITPNHANNLIIIWATLGEPDWTDGRLNCHVHKGGSALTYGRLVSEMGRGLSNTGSETHRGSIGHVVTDVAGGTSQITYDLKYKSGNGNTVRFGNGGSSNLVLMEYEV
jgi:hypothetical protein